MVQGELGIPACEAVTTSGICLSGVTAFKYACMSVAATQTLNVTRDIPFIGLQPADRLRRELGIGMGQSTRFRVQGVISLGDLIAFEHQSFGFGGYTAHFSENILDGVVCHRAVG
jgi:hypothetical protein